MRTHQGRHWMKQFAALFITVVRCVPLYETPKLVCTLGVGVRRRSPVLAGLPSQLTLAALLTGFLDGLWYRPYFTLVLRPLSSTWLLLSMRIVRTMYSTGPTLAPSHFRWGSGRAAHCRHCSSVCFPVGCVTVLTSRSGLAGAPSISPSLLMTILRSGSFIASVNCISCAPKFSFFSTLAGGWYGS